ncbi:uncharacterized protein LOC131874917 [Cryptomeria japonica]|uniref:uncharacterized protein LOC131874917 n=1 Tax=Cryptomeria japonica TaxID=3369 RepID=UPI0027DA3D8E|nr:uncharacterized protein LOC131874917 [Cryptomeria japonica]
MKKIGPFKILKKYGNNAYHIDLPSDIGLSPIYNLADIYAYKNVVHDVGVAGYVDPPTPYMMEDVLSQPTSEIEYIADKRVRKETRRQTYYEFLVKWKGKPLEDATWMTEEAIKMIGVTLSEIPTQGT